MTTEKYEQLRQKIIEANPEIMELKFGCEVVPEIDTNEIMKVFKIGTGLFGTKVWVTCKDTMDTVYLPEELKIIGRSIRLADVLLALQKLADDDENRHWCVNR